MHWISVNDYEKPNDGEWVLILTEDPEIGRKNFNKAVYREFNGSNEFQELTSAGVAPWYERKNYTMRWGMRLTHWMRIELDVGNTHEQFETRIAHSVT